MKTLRRCFSILTVLCGLTSIAASLFSLGDPSLTFSRTVSPLYDSDEASFSPDEEVTSIRHLGQLLRRAGLILAALAVVSDLMRQITCRAD